MIKSLEIYMMTGRRTRLLAEANANVASWIPITADTPRLHALLANTTNLPGPDDIEVDSLVEDGFVCSNLPSESIE